LRGDITSDKTTESEATMKQTHALRRPARLGHAALPALALLMVLALACAARAQQWTTSANGTSNISNTNLTGNVGVGTTAPSYEFHVEGASSAVNNYVQGFFRNTGAAFPYGGVGVDGQSQSHVRFFLNGAAKWQWRVGAGAGVDDLRAYNWALGSDVLTLTNSGNVGVGTTSPMSRLHVAGGAALGSIRVSGAGMAVMNFEDTAAAPGQKLYQWRSQGGVFRMTLLTDIGEDIHANILVANASGSVGVGTGSPGARLDVGAGAAARGAYTDLLIGGGGNNPQLEFYGATKSSIIAHDEAMGGVAFYVNGPPSFFIGDNQRVGVGTTSPATKLHVAGDVTVDGNISAKFQDVAEWVPSTQKLAAGTVVVLDAARTNHVVASAGAYDTKVAGVVSAEPGVILGVAGEGKLKVATTGRVKVKVDATRAPVEVGDLLVTSGVEGLAMKSVPVDLGGTPIHRPGTIIGKALEPLEKGTGEILVLLSLQ
jgi:hypothetical protein